MNELTRILLADGHAVVREGLRGLLEQQAEMAVVADTDDGHTALQLIPLYYPDVIVLDMKMLGLGVVETIAAVKRIRPQTQVLVFTSYARIRKCGR
ncbi:hypothetical protein ASD77_17460 [Pseudoxanthomonas sp. Root65]|uniref:response regulator n=1 Tax=Pseudoxanthomonas sp. Root65 TaxID=1736576 RepID=UPI0006FB6641|nr:response regulator transcription factor [Pseudoxanthomonas sp. Root65]KRA50661.1 hypothetical protein ASD77_17460 [Pseudoxanthomonas sp. Root65]